MKYKKVLMILILPAILLVKLSVLMTFVRLDEFIGNFIMVLLLATIYIELIFSFTHSNHHPPKEDLCKMQFISKHCQTLCFIC